MTTVRSSATVGSQHDYWKDAKRFRAYDHTVVRFFARQRIEYLSEWLDWCDIKNALDVGCGSGISTYYMQEHIADLWAVDRSEDMLLRHPLRAKARVGIADALALPFESNSFDLVYGWEVLHHLADPRPAVAEMARVSRRYVLVAEPNRSNLLQCLFALMDREHRLVLRYTSAYLRGLLESAALEIERVGCGGWLFPNVTPPGLLTFLGRIPYRSPLGISNWILGRKKS